MEQVEFVPIDNGTTTAPGVKADIDRLAPLRPVTGRPMENRIARVVPIEQVKLVLEGHNARRGRGIESRVAMMPTAGLLIEEGTHEAGAFAQAASLFGDNAKEVA
jgi:hypothetical protein